MRLERECSIAKERRRRRSRWRPPRSRPFLRRRVGGHPLRGGRFCRARVGGHPSRGGRFWRPLREPPPRPAHRDPGRAQIRARRFPTNSGLFLDPPQRPPQSPQRQDLIFLLVIQNVGHPGGGPRPLRLVNVSARYSWWPVFSRPSVAGFGCPPRVYVGIRRASLRGLPCDRRREDGAGREEPGQRRVVPTAALEQNCPARGSLADLVLAMAGYGFGFHSSRDDVARRASLTARSQRPPGNRSASRKTDPRLPIRWSTC